MKLRVALFDDDALVLRVLRTLCEMRGHEVSAYSDPGEFLLHLRPSDQARPGDWCADVVISDVNMPVLNGIEFVEMLIERGCTRTKYALISGHWTDENIARARKLDCRIIAKPFNLSDIMDWLEEVEANWAGGGASVEERHGKTA